MLALFYVMGTSSGLDRLTAGHPVREYEYEEHLRFLRKTTCPRREEGEGTVGRYYKKRAMRIEGKSEECESKNKGKRCFEKERMSGQQRQMVPPS